MGVQDTNAVSERSASTMQCIKNWLSSTMMEERVNHAMLLLIHKKSTDKLGLIDTTNMFCERNDER